MPIKKRELRPVLFCTAVIKKLLLFLSFSDSPSKVSFLNRLKIKRGFTSVCSTIGKPLSIVSSFYCHPKTSVKNQMFLPCICEPLNHLFGAEKPLMQLFYFSCFPSIGRSNTNTVMAISSLILISENSLITLASIRFSNFNWTSGFL